MYHTLRNQTKTPTTNNTRFTKATNIIPRGTSFSLSLSLDLRRYSPPGPRTLPFSTTRKMGFINTPLHGAGPEPKISYVLVRCVMGRPPALTFSLSCSSQQARKRPLPPSRFHPIRPAHKGGKNRVSDAAFPDVVDVW